MSRFRVYFEQINQTYIEIDVTDAELARVMATRRWRREWAQPITHVEELRDEPTSRA